MLNRLIWAILVILAIQYEAKAQNTPHIYTSTETMRRMVDNHGIEIKIFDEVEGGCWLRPQSARNKASAMFSKYGLPLSDGSDVWFVINPYGFRRGVECVVVANIFLASPQIGIGMILLGDFEYVNVSGSEQSELINDLVESFIDEIATVYLQN